MDDDFPILPLEIILNILKRLPVKSLMRFQCVCRGWKILFKTQSFITDHLNHSNHQNPCLLMKDFHLDDLSNMHCLNSEMQIWELQNPPLLSYLKQGSWKEEKFRLNGFGDVTSRGVTVNGVMFWWSYKTVGKDDDDKRLIVSFDLAVEVFTLIPTPQLHDAYGLTMYEEKLAIFSWIENSKHSVIDLWVMEDGVGFGFCPIIKDYKIVITYASLSYKELSAVKVFYISSGSWKGVEFRLNDTICLSSQSVTANGVMFWLGSKKAGDNTDDDDQDVIVSFDLAMEVFTVIPIPKLYFVPSLDVCEEIALEAQKILLSICGC
ncbi:hypothetical protein K1719_001631 [Acacia pycnantha]|nr:hypothetical protein K1719_001631 [Acacia pycnantha]